MADSFSAAAPSSVTFRRVEGMWGTVHAVQRIVHANRESLRPYMPLDTVAEEKVDPHEVYGGTPDRPVADWGWGWIPDQ